MMKVKMMMMKMMMMKMPNNQTFKQKEKTMKNKRITSEELLKALEDGLLDKDEVIMAFVKGLPESQVSDICYANEIFLEEDDDE